MASPRWVQRVVLDAAHLDQLREHGGLPAVRDDSALEAALARPQQKLHYEPDSDLATLASAYAFGIVKAHAYNDGNKRAAFLAAMIFLGLNGKDLDATEGEVVQAMIALAEGSLSEEALSSWIRQHLVRLKL